MTKKKQFYGVWVPFERAGWAEIAKQDILDELGLHGVVIPETDEIAEAVRLEDDENEDSART